MLSYIVNRTRVAHIVNEAKPPRASELEIAQMSGGVRVAYPLCSDYAELWEHSVKGIPVKATDHGVKPCLSCERVAKKLGLDCDPTNESEWVGNEWAGVIDD